MTRGWLRQAVREPLLHFTVAGTALFLVTGYYGRVDQSERRIMIDEAQVTSLADRWRQTWRRAPTAAELDGMIREHIKEEVYFREALRLGLEADDPIIRRRLRSKMEFLATAEVENAMPSSAELQRFHAANQARYATDALYSFEHRYYGEDETIARAAIAGLNAGRSALATPIPLPAKMDAASAADVAREFGDGFVGGLRSAPISKWSGPVRSGYGWHAVRVRAVDPWTIPPLKQVAQKVTNDWRAETREKREAAAYQTLLDGYDIRIVKP